MTAELWLFFTALADSPDPNDRENCLMLEHSEEITHTCICDFLNSIPLELWNAEHIFVRGFPKRLEIEVHL